MTTPAPTCQQWSIVPWLFPAGLGLVVVVNMVLLWFALATFPGAATPNAYDRGRNYGQVLERDAAVAALGWRIDISLVAGKGAVIAVRYADRDGKPIAGLAPHAVLSRPLGDASRIEVRLHETAPGIYQAEVALPRRGQWDALVVADARPVPHQAAVRLNLR